MSTLGVDGQAGDTPVGRCGEREPAMWSDLQQEQADWEDSDAGRTYVVLELAQERYAISANEIIEVRCAPESTVAIPGLPMHFLGAINLRGSVVPVVDMRSCFNCATHERAPRPVLALVETEGHHAALLFDAVLDAVEVHAEQLEAGSSQGVRADCIAGLVREKEDTLLMVLDVPALLASLEGRQRGS